MRTSTIILAVLLFGCSALLNPTKKQPSEDGVSDVDIVDGSDLDLDSADIQDLVDSNVDTGIDATDTVSEDTARDTTLDTTLDAVEDTYDDPVMDTLPSDVAEDEVVDILVDDAAPCTCATANPCCDGCYEINDCWYDESTGYAWEKLPMAVALNWSQSINYCTTLALGTYGAGSWHLPTISELRTIVDGCDEVETGGACGVTDTCRNDGCFTNCSTCSGPGPTAGCYWKVGLQGTCAIHYSSTVHEWYPSSAIQILFHTGEVTKFDNLQARYYRCVNTSP